MELLGVETAVQALRIAAQELDVVDAVQPPLASRPDDFPRHALVAVVLFGHGADNLAGEPAALVPVLELVVVELEIHGAPPLRID